MVMDRFHIMIKDTQNDMKELIKNPDKLPWYMSISQLEMTIDELDKMDQIRDSKSFYPFYPRGITDCWDMDDKLGKKLFDILEAYKKL